MNCEQCQQQMLAYLYDLLEPAERGDAAAHLESCAECRDALAIARQQQGLFAEAVKEPNAAIVFKAPAKATAASTPTVLLHDRPRRRYVLFNRWAAAAAILFVLFSGGSVIGWTVWRDHAATLADKKESLANANRNLNKAQDQLNQKKGQTQKEIKAIQEQIDKLFDTWKSEEAKKRSVLEDKGAQIKVIGPQYALAGAPNNYTIEIPKDQVQNFVNNNQFRNQQDQLPPMQGLVINRRNQKVLYEQPLKLENFKANFDVPNTVPIEPDDDIVIEIRTQTADGKDVNLRENLKIVFPDYVTHVATDRPLYRPGDTVRFRALTLERFSLKPAQQKFHLRFRILGPKEEELYRHEAVSAVVAGPKNEPVRGPDGTPLLGLGAGEFKLPDDLAAGPYTLVVNEVNERFNEERRPFVVQRWQQPRFHKELTFHRTSYGAGDMIRMKARFTPIQGPGLGNNLQIHARVVIDGRIVHEQQHQTNPDGRFEFECAVPAQLPRGVGAVSLRCDEGGSPDTLVRDIPLTTRDMQVEFFPEGGDLIAGVPNRVYFQARTPANRPADFEGRIVDDKELEVARIQTFADAGDPAVNQGLGNFSFVPEANKRYKLIIDSPIGIERHVPLPDAKEQGVAVTVLDDVATNEINVALMSTEHRRRLLVGAYCRGRVLAYQSVRAGAFQPVNLTLRPMLDVGGVYRITVFEEAIVDNEIAFRPIAERLIYRKSAQKLDVDIKTDRSRYQPGDPVRLMLQARNEKKTLVPAIALVAVVDNGVFQHANDRTARAMPTHFLLTTEVRNPEDLEYADFFLGDHPHAARSLDLLLGCQGWRRFAEQDPQLFVRRQKQQQPLQQGKNPVFIANSINTAAQVLDADPKGLTELDRDFVDKAIDLQKKLGTTEATEDGPPELQQDLNLKMGSVQQASNEVSQAEERMRGIRVYMIQFGLGGALLTLLFLGFYLVSVGLRRLSEGDGRPRRWFVAGLGLLGLLFFASIVGTIAFMGDRSLDDMKMGVALFNPGNQPILDRDELIEPPPFDLPDDGEAPKAAEEPAKQRWPNAPQRDANLLNPIGQRQNNEWNNNLFNQLEVNPPPGGAPAPPQDEERRLRQEGNYNAILIKHLGRRVQMPPVDDPTVVREYAHRRKPKEEGARRDLAETLYWRPVLVMPDGKAEVQFDLADTVSRYQVLVVSHTFDGRLGANQVELASKLPFTIDPKVPPEISSADEIAIPAAITNEAAQATSATLAARAKGLQFADKTERSLALKTKEQTRELFHVSPTLNEGTAIFKIAGKAAGVADAVERRLHVAPDGFPVTGSFSGVIEGNTVEHTINLPAEWHPGTLKVQAHFYPTTLAEISGGLDALLREPNANFEQSASINHASVLVLQHLKYMQGRQSNPVAEKQARLRLQSGYQGLAALECLDLAEPGTRRGFEWFGPAAAPNDALTAYGLVHLRELAKIHYVDADLIERTEQLLLDRRDKKGGFVRDAKNARVADHVVNAYVLWALTGSDAEHDFEAELAALRKQARAQRDAYVLALAALSHLNAKKTAEAGELLREVAALQNAEGIVAGAKTSITGSQGRDLDVETTALALQGWLKLDRAGEFQGNIQRSFNWLSRQRRGAGSYGGTQATLRALEAMLIYNQKNPKVLLSGEAQINVAGPQLGGDDPFAEPGLKPPLPMANNFDANRAAFSQRSQEMITITLDDPRALRPGANRIQLSVSNNNAMPYTLTWSYYVSKLPGDAKAPVKLSAKLDRAQAREGNKVKLAAVVENASARTQGMTVAILGLPAGMSIPEDEAQLKTLAQQNRIDAWEIRGRQLVLYWRELPPNAKNAVEVDLICRIPGVFRGPASRVYLAYDAEHPFWVEPLNVRIDAAK